MAGKRKTKKGARRFVVYLDKQIPGQGPVEEILEFPADATEDEINAECEDCLNTMIANELSTGWDEITAEEV